MPSGKRERRGTEDVGFLPPSIIHNHTMKHETKENNLILKYIKNKIKKNLYLKIFK